MTLTCCCKGPLSSLLAVSQLRYQNLGDIAKSEFDGFTPPFVKNGVSDVRVKQLKEKALKQQ